MHMLYSLNLSCIIKEIMATLRHTDVQGFPSAGRAAPRDFQRAKPQGNHEKQPCQPKENLALPVRNPDSFTRIDIIL